METKFYEFDQNNSGGYFDVDENVCSSVIIEAQNEDEAIDILERITGDQSPSCPCCEDRWSSCNREFEPHAEGVFLYDEPNVNIPSKWNDKFGKFKRDEEPSWGKKHSLFKFGCNVNISTVEEYADFLCRKQPNRTSPQIRILYLDGSKQEYFSEG